MDLSSIGADVAILLLGGLSYWNLRHKLHRIGTMTPTMMSRGDCTVWTIRYADGYTATKHSICGNIPLVEMTDGRMAKFHPNSPVISVHTSTHRN